MNIDSEAARSLVGLVMLIILVVAVSFTSRKWRVMSPVRKFFYLLGILIAITGAILMVALR